MYEGIFNQGLRTTKELDMQNNNDPRLAVLIDADNVPRRRMKGIMQELALYGTPTIKRIYGDWTSPNLASWKQELLENAITPIQQYAYTVGKNSTDSAMIIDAMDILYSERVDGFCIVSSDCDFTRLVTRLREAGMKVIGIGEKKTPSPFIAACDKFIYLEIIAQRTAEQSLADRNETDSKPKSSHSRNKKREESDKIRIPSQIILLIQESILDLADEDGWAFLGDVGNLILKKQPDFDPRNFGFNKLTTLIKSIDLFEIDIRQTSAPNVKHIYVKTRE